MENYLALVDRVLTKGVPMKDRTGVGNLIISGESFKHDLAEGFPLLTTKRMSYKAVKVELEGFIKGITDKRWYQERGCPIWDEWCSPEVVPYGRDAETQAQMLAEPDLGPIYGFQWRHFGAEYGGPEEDHGQEGVDQLAKIIDLLKTDPGSRRQVVSAWNATDLSGMAIEPCHFAFQTVVRGDKLDLVWYQRSVDLMLGLPFNIASYATLQHLLASEVGLKAGELTGQLGHVHIYQGHEDGAREQLKRKPRDLPRIETKPSSLFEWTHNKTKIKGYNPHPKINFEIAV